MTPSARNMPKLRDGNVPGAPNTPTPVPEDPGAEIGPQRSAQKLTVDGISDGVCFGPAPAKPESPTVAELNAMKRFPARIVAGWPGIAEQMRSGRNHPLATHYPMIPVCTHSRPSGWCPVCGGDWEMDR